MKRKQKNIFTSIKNKLLDWSNIIIKNSKNIITKLKKYFLEIVKIIKEKIKNIKKRLSTDKEYRKKFIIGSIILFIIIIVAIATSLYSGKARTIDYNELKSMMDKKETFVIYYYNDKSSNLKNLTIKKHLYKKGIKYYLYNDMDTDKEEYNKLLNLLNIDKKIFAPPSIIYIREGKMFGNIINIDSNRTVDNFIDNYDLYTVK